MAQLQGYTNQDKSKMEDDERQEQDEEFHQESVSIPETEESPDRKMNSTNFELHEEKEESIDEPVKELG